MNSKERVLATLEFKKPDRIPKDMWILPAAKTKYGMRLENLCKESDLDIVSIVGPFDHGFTKEYFELGEYIDPWGSKWSNIQAGIIGEVKKPFFTDYDKIDTYIPPIEQFKTEWEENKKNVIENIKTARKNEKFIIGGWVSLFERLQYLRGTEDLYCDIALEEDGLYNLIDFVMDYERVYIDKWLEMDIDAMVFGDDWGSQINLLISPDVWRKIFKPLYKELIDKIKLAGKKIFFHSDGYIMDLYPEFIELGIDAINSQIWCMGVEKVAEKYAGKITFWGELSRQTILPNGTPQEIIASAEIMKKYLLVNGTGLIGQSEINKDVPFINIETFLKAW